MTKRCLRFAGVTLAAFSFSGSASAQGCAQCLTYASAAGHRAQAWLDFGIAVLLIPTLLIFAGIFLLFVRRARAAESAAELESAAPQPAPVAAYTPAFNSSATRAI